MTPTPHVRDAFYADPDEVRQAALDAEFYQPRLYVGHRSRSPYLPPGVLDRIRETFGFERIALHNVRERSGHFYVSPSQGERRTAFFSHFDLARRAHDPAFSLVVYLTPDAPPNSGTGLYRHRATGVWRHPTAAEARCCGFTRAALLNRLDEDGYHRRRWEELSRVANGFNRAVLFPAYWYHSSTRDYGAELARSKLYQAFFFHGWPNPFAAEDEADDARFTRLAGTVAG